MKKFTYFVYTLAKICDKIFQWFSRGTGQGVSVHG